MAVSSRLDARDTAIAIFALWRFPFLISKDYDGITTDVSWNTFGMPPSSETRIRSCR